MKIRIIQPSITPDVEANKAMLRAEIVAAANEGAELVVLQELHNTPYFCQTENTELFNLDGIHCLTHNLYIIHGYIDISHMNQRLVILLRVIRYY